MVEVIADLEPVAEDGDGEGAWGEFEAFTAEFRDSDGGYGGDEEG